MLISYVSKYAAKEIRSRASLNEFFAFFKTGIMSLAGRSLKKVRYLRVLSMRVTYWSQIVLIVAISMISIPLL